MSTGELILFLTLVLLIREIMVIMDNNLPKRINAYVNNVINVIGVIVGIIECDILLIIIFGSHLLYHTYQILILKKRHDKIVKESKM